MPRAVLVGLATLMVIAGMAQPATAQYFGQNKVQHRQLDFKVLATEHFDIHYYPAEEAAAREVARMAERWYTRFSGLLGHQLNGRQPVILYASHPEFEQTNVIEGPLGEGTGGVTEGGLRRIVLPMAATLADTDHVLGHELVHAFQYDILGRSIGALPLWMIEGMAEYYSLGAGSAQTAMWLRDAAYENRLPAIKDLSNPRFFPYRFGHAFWAYFAGKYGDTAIPQFLGLVASPEVGASAEAALEQIAGLKHEDLSAEWHKSIRATYDIAEGAERPGRVVGEGARIGADGDRGRINVGPALSPDGRYVAFLSERSRLSIDLYLADAQTGAIVRRLTSTAADPHFDSLQFLASAGTWRPDGAQLAVGTVRNGHGALALFDAANGDLASEIAFEDIGEIFHPAWSPDGSSIAFAGQAGGVTNLYVHVLASGETRKLTDDLYADLQPAWSRDGRTIAFVTERFGANLSTLTFNGLRLATIDLESRAVREVGTGFDATAINPQWSSDDRTIYFLATAGARPNLFRVPRTGGTAERLTSVATGIAGITPTSPALSVAATGDRAAISVFVDGGFEIQVLAPGTVTPLPSAAAPDPPRLPGATEQPGAVDRALAAPTAGLPIESAVQDQEYSAGLKLVGIGQSGGVSTSAFGTYFVGGLAMQFSDVLGEHLLGVGIAANGELKDIGGSVNYINRTKRWNWGVFGEHVPLVSGTGAAGFTTIDGQQVYVEQTLRFRQMQTQTGALTAFPFSRSLRVEFNAAVRRIGFDQELRTLIFDPFTGTLLSDEREDLGSPDAINLVSFGAGLVGDTAVYGATSPILGRRFRFDVNPNFGDLDLTDVTLDVRQYVMPLQPVTFAARALHVGRYGTGGEDSRLSPLFLGYSTLVRGYDSGSFNANECTPADDGSCAEFDRLLGSRIFVFNGEVRASLVGMFTGQFDYGPVPVEVFGFADTGIAWSRGDRPALPGNLRRWVTSVGAGARVNLFGFAIGEFNLVRALDRRTRGWSFVFNLRPGF
jgi:Tol biopolymer transport system component